jgi:hypothetical protein
MQFTTPGAAVAAALLLVLLLLGYWRRRSRPVEVPSLRLWSDIPDRLPPIEKKRAPRVTLLMILQLAAAACLVLAMMGPFVFRAAPPPRRLVVGLDLSARMAAGGRFEQARQLIRRWCESLAPDDVVELHASDRQELRPSEVPAALARLAPLNRAVPTAPLAARVAAVRGRPDEQVIRFLVTDARVELPESVALALVGTFVPNAGIVDASVADERLAVTVAAHPRRKVVVKINAMFDADEIDGEQTFFFPAPEDDFSIELGPADAFAADDRVQMIRRLDGTIRVSYEGPPDHPVARALAADPRVLMGSDGDVRVRVGSVVEAFRGSFEAPGAGEPRPPGPLTLADHPVLLRDVRADELGVPSAREVPGTWLIKDGDRIVCAYEDGRVLCGLEPLDSEWRARESFPIFWHNVLTFLAGPSARGSWEAHGLLDRNQSRIPDPEAPPAPDLSSAGTARRKFRLDEGLLVAAVLLMLTSWAAGAWAERREFR